MVRGLFRGYFLSPPKIHNVRQGECIASISLKYGFNPETIWNDPANAQLKNNRPNHYVLYPSDQVTIPELRTKEEEAVTDNRHKYRRKGMPVYLNLQLFSESRKPLANKSFTLRVGGKVSQGTTDGEGCLKIPIPPQEKEGVLIIENRNFNIRIGYLNPLGYNSGIRSRLNNLGYKAGAGGEEMDAELRRALEAFQEDQGLPKTGEIDEATINALHERHKF